MEDCEITQTDRLAREKADFNHVHIGVHQKWLKGTIRFGGLYTIVIGDEKERGIFLEEQMISGKQSNYKMGKGPD